MSFGRQTPQLDKVELSQLLVQYAARQLCDPDMLFEPTQTEIAKEIGVSQPMVNGVIHERKYFSQERLSRYAKQHGMTLADLLTELLSISGNNSSLDAIDGLRQGDSMPTLLLNAYETSCRRLECERMQSFRVPEKTFDAFRAFCELLSFVVRHASATDIDGYCAALVSLTKDRGFAVSKQVGASADGIRRWRFKELPIWLKENIANATNEIEGRLRSVPMPHSFKSSEDWNWLTLDSDGKSDPKSRRVIFHHVFTEESSVDSENTASHVLLFVFNDTGLSECQYDTLRQILFLASRLGERIAMYGLEDRLRCANRVIDAQVWKEQIIAPHWTDESDLETAEHFAQRLLSTLCEKPIAHADIVTADIWLYRISQNQFVSPSEYFRHVSARYANKQTRDAHGQELSIRELYMRSYKLGELTPRPFGRTTYMVANNIATFTNHSDNDGSVTHWSSCPELDFGTFVGIPFMLTPTGPSGPRHISVLYMRCWKDLEPDESKKLIQWVTKLMRTEFQSRFIPMFKGNRALTVQERSDKRWGKWYEVSQDRKTRNKTPSPESAVSGSK